MTSTLAFDIIARDRASSTFDKVGDSASKSGDKVKKWAKAGALAAGAAALAVGKFAIDAIGSASDVQQSFGALDSVYGKNAKQVKKWAEGAADSVGLAKSEYADLSALVGSQLQGMGTASDVAAKKSNTLIKMGADLAATYGGSVKDAVEAVSSTLKGETDPIERYGVSIKASDVSARLAADGLDKLEGKAKKQATAQATLALLTEQTSKAQGAFGRESDTLAGKQERLKAKFENIKASIGEKLLPVATQFFGFLLDKGVPAVERLGDWFQQKLLPPLRDFAEKHAPKANQIMEALKGAFQDARPFIEMMGKILINVVVPGLSKLVDVVGGALIGNIKTVGRVLGALGDAGKWMWNNALQPAFSMLAKAISVVLSGFSSMLNALGKVPGFGWAEKAADSMAKAAAKAQAVADSIKKIPNKTVSVTVAYKYTGLRAPGGNGPTRSTGDDHLGIDPRMAQTAKPAAQRVMEAIADGLRDGGKKVDKVLLDAKSRIKDRLGSIRDEMKSLSSSIASALNPTDFGSGLTELMASLTGNNGTLSNLLAVFDKLKGSVSKGFLSALMQSGNAGLATQLASDPGAAAQASALFDQNAVMAQSLGDQTAQQVMGDQIDKALTREITRLVRELKEAQGAQAKKIRQELEGLRLELTGGGKSAGQGAHVKGAW